MGMLSTNVKGDYSQTLSWLKKIKFNHLMHKLEKYGEKGVEALRDATPKRTGKTANSWDYKIDQTQNSIKITWVNDNFTDDHIPVAILIQYGHGTNGGGYVQGVDYINPALGPIFDEIVEKIWKEITEL